MADSNMNKQSTGFVPRPRPGLTRTVRQMIGGPFRVPAETLSGIATNAMNTSVAAIIDNINASIENEARIRETRLTVQQQFYRTAKRVQAAVILFLKFQEVYWSFVPHRKPFNRELVEKTFSSNSSDGSTYGRSFISKQNKTSKGAKSRGGKKSQRPIRAFDHRGRPILIRSRTNNRKTPGGSINRNRSLSPGRNADRTLSNTFQSAYANYSQRSQNRTQSSSKNSSGASSNDSNASEDRICWDKFNRNPNRDQIIAHLQWGSSSVLSMIEKARNVAQQFGEMGFVESLNNMEKVVLKVQQKTQENLNVDREKVMNNPKYNPKVNPVQTKEPRQQSLQEEIQQAERLQAQRQQQQQPVQIRPPSLQDEIRQAEQQQALQQMTKSRPGNSKYPPDYVHFTED